MENKKIKITISVIIALFLILILSACTTPKTIEFGKKCTGDGSVYSYVWIKDKNTDANIKSTNCI